MKNGEVKDHMRWCETHNQFHGVLYPCNTYPLDLLNNLRGESERYITNLKSHSWCKKEMEKSGITEIEIEIFRAMAGIEEEDWTE